MLVFSGVPSKVEISAFITPNQFVLQVRPGSSSPGSADSADRKRAPKRNRRYSGPCRCGCPGQRGGRIWARFTDPVSVVARYWGDRAAIVGERMGVGRFLSGRHRAGQAGWVGGD